MNSKSNSNNMLKTGCSSFTLSLNLAYDLFVVSYLSPPIKGSQSTQHIQVLDFSFELFIVHRKCEVRMAEMMSNFWVFIDFKNSVVFR